MSHPQTLPGDDTGGHEELQTLKRRANAEHRACEEAVRSTLAHAINCGELLEEAKRKAGHGNFGAWLSANFEASHDTANLYMNLARHKEQLTEPNSERVRNLSLREARRLISGLDEDDNDSEGEASEETALGKRGSGKRGGLKKGPRGPGRGDPPEPMIYSVSDLPVPESGLRRALCDGRAIALRSDAPAGAEKALGDARSFLEDSMRTSWGQDLDARLLVVCAPDVPSLARACETAGRALAFEDDCEEPSDEEMARYQARELRAADGAEPTLYKIVEARGGIDPRRSSLKEEWAGVNNKYKRKGGLAPDVMADEIRRDHPELDIEEERDLIEKLSA